MDRYLIEYYLPVLDRLSKVTWATKKMTFKVLKMSKDELECLVQMTDKDFYETMMKLEHEITKIDWDKL